jgi:hypothetical protein
MNGCVEYKLCNDVNLNNEISESVRNIIGDKRYEKLLKLNHLNLSTPLLSFGDGNGGLPFISISLFYADDNEKKRLENIITNIVQKYLMLYGWSTQVLVDWKTRQDLNMPSLCIKYARTAKEKKIMNIELQDKRKKIISQYAPVVDDTEDDLYDD